MASKHSRTPDKEISFKEDYKIKIYKELTEDKGGPVETIVLISKSGDRELAKLVRKDGELIESSATTDAQDSGLYADLAKKYGISEEDLTYTKATQAAMQAKIEERDGLDDSLKKAAPKYTAEKLAQMKQAMRTKNSQAEFPKKVSQIKAKNSPKPEQDLEAKVRSRYGLAKDDNVLDYSEMNKTPKKQENVLDYAAMSRQPTPSRPQIARDKSKASDKVWIKAGKGPNLKKNMAAGYPAAQGAGATGVSAMSATQPMQMSKADKVMKGLMSALRKDNVAHPAGSPQDSAHDVKEEGSSFHKEMSTASKSPGGIKAFLQHLRDSKDSPGWKRSPSNQSAGLRKSLFNEPELRAISAVEYTPSKESLADDVRWSIDRLNELSNLRWLIEDEFPKEKELFEEIFSIYKKNVVKAIKEYKSADKLKKSQVLQKKQGVPKGVDPAKHERCVKDVKKESPGYNPYAVCNSTLKKCITSMRKTKTPILTD